ncbi:hypothetical protein PFDG_05280 [Plasmodium falciparum Dd2]|uniref:Protein kinase domain-containing protein n=1 Tax=Plasmodium falciparum (isolate Dd2) TaxID=57267 RepID=A0A0L7MA45_PLAF4|nr:hypothetical protein PFDG_05280 [Plasmodium falciparum Dd2]
MAPLYTQKTDIADRTYIAMELCEGGDLMSRIKNSESFHATNINNIMFQVLCDIAYMHSTNIAHKDLQPETILFQSKRRRYFKNYRFWSSGIISKSEGISKTAAGTVRYSAPEVFKTTSQSRRDIVSWSYHVFLIY